MDKIPDEELRQDYHRSYGQVGYLNITLGFQDGVTLKLQFSCETDH